MNGTYSPAARLLFLARSGVALCLGAALATAQYHGSASRHGSFKPGDGHTTFPTAEAAAQALVNAAAADDTAALELLFGPSARKILSSGDSVPDKNRRAAFAACAKRLMKVERDPEEPHRATILIGGDAFPFPAFRHARGKQGAAGASDWSQRNRRHRPL